MSKNLKKFTGINKMQPGKVPEWLFFWQKLMRLRTKQNEPAERPAISPAIVAKVNPPPISTELFRVLVVDKNTEFCRKISSLLPNSESNSPLYTSELHTALNYVRDYNIWLVFLDITLGVKNAEGIGSESLKLIDAIHGQGRGALIIAISSEEFGPRRAIESQVQTHIQKPIHNLLIKPFLYREFYNSYSLAFVTYFIISDSERRSRFSNDLRDSTVRFSSIYNSDSTRFASRIDLEGVSVTLRPKYLDYVIGDFSDELTRDSSTNINISNYDNTFYYRIIDKIMPLSYESKSISDASTDVDFKQIDQAIKFLESINLDLNDEKQGELDVLTSDQHINDQNLPRANHESALENKDLSDAHKDHLYSDVLSECIKLTHTARSRVRGWLEPALNLYAQSMPTDSLEQKKGICSRVNSDLELFGLALKCPKTGLPTKLKATTGNFEGSGRFYFEAHIDGKRKITAWSESLPKLEFIDAHPTKTPETLWQHIIEERRKSSNREIS